MATEEEKKDENQQPGEAAPPEKTIAEQYPKYKYYEFPDGAMYFGETEYISKSGKIIPNIAEITNEEEKATIQIMRQGYGIMLYGVTKNEEGVPISFSSKYSFIAFGIENLILLSTNLKPLFK